MYTSNSPEKRQIENDDVIVEEEALRLSHSGNLRIGGGGSGGGFDASSVNEEDKAAITEAGSIQEKLQEMSDVQREAKKDLAEAQS